MASKRFNTARGIIAAALALAALPIDFNLRKPKGTRAYVPPKKKPKPNRRK